MAGRRAFGNASTTAKPEITHSPGRQFRPVLYNFLNEAGRIGKPIGRGTTRER